MGNWFFLVIAMLIAFIASGDRMSYGVFVLPVSQAFDLTRSQAVIPLSLSMVVWGVAQPFVGALMDTYGPRRVILASLGLMGLGFMASAAAQNLVQLTLSYGILVGGASAGLAVAAFSVMISRRFGQQQRGRAIGFALAGIPLGTMVFAPFASELAYGWSWQGAFVVLGGILFLIALPLAWTFLREPPRPSVASQPRNPGVLSLFSGEVFQAVKTRAYWLMLLAYFGCGSSGLFMQGHLPAIALGFGFTPQVGATGLGLTGASGAVGAIIGGWAADRYGRYRILAVGYLIRALGFFLMTFFVSDVTSFYVFALITGLGVFWTITVTQTVIYEIFGPGMAGRMLGLTFLLHQVGSTIGPYFGGRLFEVRGSYELPLLLGGVVLVMSALWSWLLKAAAQQYVARRSQQTIPTPA